MANLRWQRIVALGLLLTVCASAQSQTTRPSDPATQEVGSRDGAEDRLVKREGGSDIWPWVQTLLALALVVALIFGVRFVLKRFSALGGPVGSSGAVEVLARSALSPKERLFVVRFGRRVLLLGSAPGGLTTLSEITDAEEISNLLAAVKSSKGGALADREAPSGGKVQQKDGEGGR